MSERLLPVIVTVPEKLLRGSWPPAGMETVRPPWSVSCCSDATAGAASASTLRIVIAGIWPNCVIYLPRHRLRREAAARRLRGRKKLESAGVNRHAGDGVDAEAVEPVDVLLRGDAAGRGDVAGPRPPHGRECPTAYALPHPLHVHLREHSP